MSSQSTESTASVEFLAWLEVNKKRVIIAAVAIGAVAGVLALYRYHQNEVEAQANQALFKIQAAAESAGPDKKSPDAAGLIKVADEFKGTSAGSRARLLAAGALFEGGKYAESRAQFENYLQQDPSSTFASTAAYGIAASLDAEGKAPEAIAAYQNVVARYGTSAAATQAKLALAGLNEGRKDFTQALRLYGELTGTTAQTAWSMEAMQRREALLREHPELTPTNALAVTTNTPALSTNALPAAAQ